MSALSPAPVSSAPQLMLPLRSRNLRASSCTRAYISALPMPSNSSPSATAPPETAPQVSRSLPSPPPLGYIPAGSTNDFAASLHLPDQPLEAARVITASGGRPLDVGSFNGRPFIYVASFGAFTRASYSAPQNVKNDLGHLAYILEGVKDLSTLRPYRASVATEEECFDGEFLFGAVTNATSVGGLVKLKEDQVCLDDGLFELLLIPNPKSIADLQGLARSLLLQDFTGGGVIFRHVHTLTVQTPEDLPWALDGEFDPGGAQVEIHNLHRRLTFLI